MSGLLRSIKAVWSVVGVIHGIWSLFFLGAVGWLLGSEVFSSGLLGALFAISLPLGTMAALSWDRNRRARLTPAHRLFVGSEIQFLVLRKMSERKFPSENWVTIADGPSIVALAHPLARRFGQVRRMALGHLVRDQQRIATAAGIDDNWILLVLVMPGRCPAEMVVVDGKPVQVADHAQAVDIIRNGLHVPGMVRAKLLSAIR